MVRLGISGATVYQWDDDEAAIWFHKAAKRGHAESSYRLALMVDAGRVLDNTYPAWAFTWMKKAAEKGHREAYTKAR